MIGIALIVVAILLYKSYKLKLKHDSELASLREDNASLRAQLEALRRDYEQVMSHKQATSYYGTSERHMSDADRIAQLAETIRRKEPFM